MSYPKGLNENESIDIDNEIAEAALQGVEHMVAMCPNEAQNVVNPVLELVGSSITYDPNYQYNEGDDEEMEDTEQQDNDYGWDDDDLDDAQDFDDDTAWKVRKSTVKVIEAVF